MFDTIVRTIFFYFFITFAYRIMGKREVGQLGIIDLIVSILIAEIVALSIEKTDQSIFLAIIPISLLVILEIVLAYISVKSRIFNKIFGGKPTILIDNGKVIYKNLVSQRYTIDDLLLELRKNQIASIEDVEYAFLETNGKLSVFPYKPFKIKSDLPLPVVIEGIIQSDTLKNINKSEVWLRNILKENEIPLKQVFYAIYRNNHMYIIKKQ